MKKTVLIVSIVIAVFAAIISALPLAWIGPHLVPSSMSKDTQFSGTIWQGRADMPFGKSRAPVSFKAAPIKLISGQSFLDFSVQNSGLSLQGLAGFRTAQDIYFSANIAQLPLLDPRIRGLSGQITAQISDAKFGNACKHITGDARTNFLQANEATWFWRGPELSGPVRCEDGNIIIEMSGREDGQGFTLELRLNADGVYTAQMKVDTADPRAGVVLGFYGFEPQGKQFVLSETGRWR